MRALPIALLATVLALPAQDGDPILARLPADTTNVLVVRDVMPHAFALLGSQQLADALAVAGNVQEELFGMRLDAANLRRQIGLFRDFVPTEVVVAGSDRTVADLVRVGEAAFAAVMLRAFALGDVDDATVEEVRSRLLPALRGLVGFDALAWLRLRNERTAEQWFDAVAEAAADAGDGVAVEEHEARLTVRIRPMRCLGGVLPRYLAEHGVDAPDDLDPELVVVLQQRGAELELRLGAPGAGPLAAERLGPLWRSGAEQMLFAKTDPGAAGQAGEAFVDLLFTVAEEFGDDLPQIAALADNVWQLLDPTTASIVVDDGFHMTKEVAFGDDIEDLLDDPDPAVVRCVAADEGPFVLSALPLDALLYGGLDELDLRLARRGEGLPEATWPVFAYLAAEDSAVFDPGVLVATRPARFRGAREWRLGEMPFAALGVVAKAVDAASAGEFMAQVEANLQSGYGLDAPLWREADLGLGVPTHTFDLEVLVPGQAAWGVDADFVPHWCVVGDVLVIATDPRLSTDLVARIRGEATTPLPVGRLIDWSRWSGTDWVDTCAGIARWWRAVPESVLREANALRGFDAVCDTLAALGRSVESLETVTELDGEIVREVTRLRLRAPK